jgi:UDP-glucose:(heptosyl)LPS alpha-1,3-glucosyltransferase
MRLAFCLFKYFPYGGLQRDFLRIARACLARGHRVEVYTLQWIAEVPQDLVIHILKTQGLQNHKRRENFVKQLQAALKLEKYDLIVGFNKMPGLDVYYAADTCYQAKARKQHGFLYRLTRRYRATLAFEQAVFDARAQTKILLIAPREQQEFMRYYATSPERFHLLLPGISQDRIQAANATSERASTRAAHQLNDDDFLLLMVGSGFKTKGLDRALQAVSALPSAILKRTHLFVIGADNEKPFLRLAARLGIQKHIHFLGGREDVPRYYLAADLLLHPAYNENTGTVLLEAMASGLPVLTTDVCGYAHYVKSAGGGAVLPSPFDQLQFNKTLANMLLSPDHPRLRENALAFAKTADIYSMPERAAAIIESLR